MPSVGMTSGAGSETGSRGEVEKRMSNVELRNVESATADLRFAAISKGSRRDAGGTGGVGGFRAAARF